MPARFYLLAYCLQDKEEDLKFLRTEGLFTVRMCLICQQLFPVLTIFLFSWLHVLCVQENCYPIFKSKSSWNFKDNCNETQLKKNKKCVLSLLDVASWKMVYICITWCIIEIMRCWGVVWVGYLDVLHENLSITIIYW